MRDRYTHLMHNPLTLSSLLVGLLLAMGIGIFQVVDNPAVVTEDDVEIWAMVDTGRLNVREGSAVGFSVQDVISDGDDIGLLTRNKDGSWVKVLTESGDVGWVSTLYILAETSLRPIPPLPVDEESVVEPYAWIQAPIVNVRTGPAYAYDSLMTLDQYELVSLVGRDSKGYWVLVRYESEVIGWINAEYVGRYIETLRGLPISDTIITEEEPEDPMVTAIP